MSCVVGVVVVTLLPRRLAYDLLSTERLSCVRVRPTKERQRENAMDGGWFCGERSRVRLAKQRTTPKLLFVVVEDDDDEGNLLTRCQLVASYWRSSNAHARAARVQYETLQV